jgi:hypothetical protein
MLGERRVGVRCIAWLDDSGVMLGPRTRRTRNIPSAEAIVQKRAFVAKRSGIKIRSLASMSSQHIEVYLAGRTALATRNAGYMDHMQAAVNKLGDWPGGPGGSRGNTKTMYEVTATDTKMAAP